MNHLIAMHSGVEDWYVDVFDGTITQKPRYNVDEIPPDYLLHILSLLSFPDRVACRAVSRMWKLCLDYILSQQQELSIGEQYVNKQSYYPWHYSPTSRLFACEHRYAVQTTTPSSFYQVTVGDEFSIFITSRMTSLTVLQFGSLMQIAGSQSQQLIAHFSGQLICLDCPFYDVEDKEEQPAFPKLKHLICRIITNKALWDLCPKLEQLQCTGKHVILQEKKRMKFPIPNSFLFQACGVT